MLSSVLVKLACGVEEGINGVEKVINTIVSRKRIRDAAFF